MKFSWIRLPEYQEVHQPRMKVFTVGLDEKEKAKAMAEDKMETGSVNPDPKPATPVVVPVAVKRPSGYCKGWFSLVVCMFFVIILALTISEISYNRQRDEQFLRLKWAELKQRMLGMEILRQTQAQAQAAQQAQLQSLNDQPPEVVDERLAFSRRLGQEDSSNDSPVAVTTVKPIVPENKDSEETSEEKEGPSGDLRLEFLRAILGRIREQAAAQGLNTDKMQVSVIQLKKPAVVSEEEEPLATFDQSMADGFGEWHAPRPFGPYPREQDYFDYDGQMPFGRQFDRESFRGPARDKFPQKPWNQDSSEMNAWGFNNNNNNNEFNPDYAFSDDGEMGMGSDGRPQMRITHHFDKQNQMPKRIVTEFYGDNAEQVLKNLMGNQVDGSTGQQPEQQQMPLPMPVQQPFGQQQNQAPLPVGVHFPLPEQPWLHQNNWQNYQPQQQFQPQQPSPNFHQQQQFAQQFGQAFGQNFGQNWEQAQRNWQHNIPQQFNIPQQWNGQFPQQPQQQAPPQVPQQPQQPQNVQNAAPFETRPWYQSDAWSGEQKAIGEKPIVSDTAAIAKGADEEDQEEKFTNLNKEENEGIDNFERKEQFNVPTDVIADDEPVEIKKPEMKTDSWQNAQPQPAPAEETPVASEPVESPASFLPLRDDFKEDPPAPVEEKETEKEAVFPEEPENDEFQIDKHSPLFQIDDPHSFKH